MTEYAYTLENAFIEQNTGNEVFVIRIDDFAQNKHAHVRFDWHKSSDCFSHIQVSNSNIFPLDKEPIKFCIEEIKRVRTLLSQNINLLTE